MKKFKTDVAQLEKDVQKKTEEIYLDIAEKCSEKIADELDDCFGKMEESARKISESAKEADAVFSKAAEIGDAVSKSTEAAQEFIRGTEVVKGNISEFCEEVEKSILKAKEVSGQAVVSKEEIEEATKQYTEKVSAEVELLAKTAREWEKQIDEIVRNNTTSISSFNRNLETTKENVEKHHKALCDAIENANNTLLSVAGQCSDSIKKVETEFFDLLAKFSENCVLAENRAATYTEALKASSEKIDSIHKELAESKIKIDEIPVMVARFIEEQRMDFAKMEKEAKKRFVITATLVATGIIVEIISFLI